MMLLRLGRNEAELAAISHITCCEVKPYAMYYNILSSNSKYYKGLIGFINELAECGLRLSEQDQKSRDELIALKAYIKRQAANLRSSSNMLR
jgi:hypothetical protein